MDSIRDCYYINAKPEHKHSLVIVNSTTILQRRKMKSVVNFSVVIVDLLLMMHLAAARSLPSQQIMEMTNIETNSGNINTDSAANYQTELESLSIPSYLKDLYTNLTYPNGVSHTSSNPEEIKVNTIQSYKNQVKNASCGYYKFDVHKDRSDKEEIVRAELRLLQKPLTTLDGYYNVDIFYLLNESSHQSPLKFSFKHIDSTPGWKTFDITPLVLNWKRGLVNHGLQLQLTRGKKILSCEGVFSQGEEDPMNTEPLLIVFTNDHDSKFFQHMLKEERKSLKNDHALTQPKERKQRAVKVQNTACHRKEMKVTANSLSAGDVHVLLPKSFDAGVCEGHCTKLQLSPNTDHAHILSLYYHNTRDLSAIPSRCCVPTRYKKINMIFHNQRTGEHIIKQDVPAQATECDCL